MLQDVRTIHGSQFRDAQLIVASSPCQEFSYRAMPWKRAKALGPPLLGIELFEQAGRIQREACEASGRFLPMIQENVRGAQPYVGRARWHFGSFYLWGDVPALMPTTFAAHKNPGFRFDGSGRSFQTASVEGMKNRGGSCFAIGSPGQKVTRRNPDGRKNGGDWFGSGNDCSEQRRAGSKTPARKFAQARIAKIPFALAYHIGLTYLPTGYAERAS